MRRLVPLLTLVLAGAGTPAALAADPTTPPSAALEHFACRHASNALNRAIEVTAVMHARAGAPSLAIEFVLLRRVRGGEYEAVHSGDLGRWITPDPPTLGQRPDDVWRLYKPVVDLEAPATYRFEVTFRWSGDAGASETTLRSPRCVQAA